MDTYYKFDNTAYNYSSSIVHPFGNIPIIHASDIILDNTVIKVESEEHGKRVIEWWKEQGVDVGKRKGSGTIMNYYGIYDGIFDNNSEAIALKLGKKIITLPETFPSKWYLKITNENKEVANEWRRSVCGSVWGSEILCSGYLLLSKHDYDTSYFCGEVYFDEHKSFYSDYSEINIEQFLEHVYNPWKYKPIKGQILIKQENKMGKIISWREAQELIGIVSDSCQWKERLLFDWAKSIALKENIEVSNERLQQGRKEASQSQKEVIDRIFGKEKEEIVIPKMVVDGFIAKRVGGEYAHKSFCLSKEYEWEFKYDSFGFLCLIPTHK
jgi:hypothetical protein